MPRITRKRTRGRPRQEASTSAQSADVKLEDVTWEPAPKKVKHERLYHDGYAYHNNRMYQNKRYLVCVHLKDLCCKGRAVLVNESGVSTISVIRKHNHARNKISEIKNKFMLALKEAAATSNAPLKAIYDDMCSTYEDMPTMLPFSEVKCSMYRSRKAFQPKVPESLAHFAVLLRQNEYSRFIDVEGGLFFAAVPVPGGECMVFGQPTFISNFANCENIYIDVSFQLKLDNTAYHIFNMHVLSGEQSVPIVWALMTNKSKDCLKILLEFTKENLTFCIKPGEIFTGYDYELVTAINEAYPVAKTYGCFFHFAQAVCRKARKLKLINFDDDCEVFNQTVKMVLSIALCPADMAHEALDVCQQEVFEGLRAQFKPFFTYMREQWLNEITPSEFCVYKSKKRTSNNIEYFQHQLKSCSGLWSFTEKTVGIVKRSMDDIKRMREGKSIPTWRKQKHIVYEKQYAIACDLLENEKCKLSDFLYKTGDCMDTLFTILNFNSPQENEDDPILISSPPPPPFTKIEKGNSSPSDNEGFKIFDEI